MSIKKILISLMIFGLLCPASALAEAANDGGAKALTLTSAKALDQVTLELIFSEEIVLPTEKANEAFTIEKVEDLTPLAVSEVKLDTKDTTNKTALLTTVKQESGVDYIVTVTDKIKNKAGKSITVGSSDTAIFVGSSVAETAAIAAVEEKEPVKEPVKETPSEKVAPTVFFAEPKSKTEIIVYFSEPVKLSATPLKDFTIVETQNAENVIELLEAKLSSDGLSAVLTTEMQEGGKQYTVSVSQQVRDLAGNQIEQAKSTKNYLGFLSPEDKTEKQSGTKVEPLPVPPRTPKTGPELLFALIPALGAAGIIRKYKKS